MEIPDESRAREVWLAALDLCEATASADLERVEELVASTPRALLFSAFVGAVGALLPRLADQPTLREALLRLRNEPIETL